MLTADYPRDVRGWIAADQAMMAIFGSSFHLDRLKAGCNSGIKVVELGLARLALVLIL